MSGVFSPLPLELKQDVIRKLEIKDVAALEQSSLIAAKAVKSVKTLFQVVNRALFMHINQEIWIRFGNHYTPYKLKNGPQLRFDAKLVTIEDNLNPVICGKVLDFVRKTGSKFPELKVNVNHFWPNHGLCSSSALNELIEASGVKKLTIGGYGMPQVYFLNLPETISSLSFNAPVGDEVLEKLQTPELDIQQSHIDYSGLNHVLEEWFAGKRTIEHILITTDKILLKEAVLDGIPYSKTFHKCLFKLHNGSDVLYVKIKGPGTFEAGNAIYRISNLR